MSLELTLFLESLQLFVKMRLTVRFAGKKIVFFGSTDQKLWMFEVLRKSMGRVGMCWSQPARVDYISQERWAVGIKNLVEKPFESFLSNRLNLAPTLGRVKSSFPHGTWRFIYFSNFIFDKFRVHLDLHIHRWDFCFIKK
jgi:hypothetical protein